jgi:hypothetical protein
MTIVYCTVYCILMYSTAMPIWTHSRQKSISSHSTVTMAQGLDRSKWALYFMALTAWALSGYLFSMRTHSREKSMPSNSFRGSNSLANSNNVVQVKWTRNVVISPDILRKFVISRNYYTKFRIHPNARALHWACLQRLTAFHNSLSR